MLKQFCDCCDSEIKGNEKVWKITINKQKKNGELIHMDEQINDMDFCEACIEKVKDFICEMGKSGGNK